MKDYNAPFKNSSIDRLGDKFGKKSQTVKPVTVRPSAEQVSRVKGRMESDINRMDAETHGYERGASSIRTGWSFDQESMESERKDTKDSFFDYHAAPYKGKNMADTRSVYQASKRQINMQRVSMINHIIRHLCVHYFQKSLFMIEI